jgi:hypothetical protein
LAESHHIGELPVPESLHLEFACTDAETKQARSLHLRRQVGGGSKVLTLVILLLLLVGMVLTFYFRVQREVTPAYRPYVYAAVFAVALLAWVWIRRSRASTPIETRLEVSDDGLSIRTSGAAVRMPWSGFSSLLESPDLFVLVDRPKTTLLVIPKRAFPSESRQEWFLTLATNQLNLADQPPAEAPAARPSTAGDSIHLRLQLRFRDYLDRTLASWLTRGFLAGITALMIGVSLHAAANPPPNAIFSGTQLFFMFVIPSLLVMMVFLTLVFSVHAWWTHSRNAVPQELSLSRESIAFSGRDGSGTLPWSVYGRFQETRWSFILWNPRTSAWTMFPKRAFTSEEDMRRCRDILSRHLQQSRWFFG